MSSTASAVGRFLPAVSSLLRPPAGHELGRYGAPALLRGKRVLDVGSGDGRLAFGAGAYAAEVVGLDPDPEAIRAAKEKARAARAANVHFRVGYAQELPFPDGRFDVVILSWTL